MLASRFLTEVSTSGKFFWQIVEGLGRRAGRLYRTTNQFLITAAMPTAQSVLLGVHCKRTENVDIKAPLHGYIKTTYSARQAEEGDDDLDTIQHLRKDIVMAQPGAQGASNRETLSK